VAVFFQIILINKSQRIIIRRYKTRLNDIEVLLKIVEQVKWNCITNKIVLKGLKMLINRSDIVISTYLFESFHNCGDANKRMFYITRRAIK
jgi:hypothetical protein